MNGDIDLNGDITISQDFDWMSLTSSADGVKIFNCHIATFGKECVDC